MQVMRYKPQTVIKVLDISREQFKYWRRELDSRPTRPHFSYQLILAYAVLKELIDACCYPPHILKQFDIQALFIWFEQDHGYDERQQTVIVLDRQHKTIQFQQLTQCDRSAQHPYRTDLVFLRDIERQVQRRMMN